MPLLHLQVGECPLDLKLQAKCHANYKTGLFALIYLAPYSGHCVFYTSHNRDLYSECSRQSYVGLSLSQIYLRSSHYSLKELY